VLLFLKLSATSVWLVTWDDVHLYNASSCVVDLLTSLTSCNVSLVCSSSTHFHSSAATLHHILPEELSAQLNEFLALLLGWWWLWHFDSGEHLCDFFGRKKIIIAVQLLLRGFPQHGIDATDEFSLHILVQCERTLVFHVKKVLGNEERLLIGTHPASTMSLPSGSAQLSPFFGCLPQAENNKGRFDSEKNIFFICVSSGEVIR